MYVEAIDDFDNDETKYERIVVFLFPRLILIRSRRSDLHNQSKLIMRTIINTINHSQSGLKQTKKELPTKDHDQFKEIVKLGIKEAKESNARIRVHNSLRSDSIVLVDFGNPIFKTESYIYVEY